jgi:hypothetical protein
MKKIILIVITALIIASVLNSFSCQDSTSKVKQGSIQKRVNNVTFIGHDSKSGQKVMRWNSILFDLNKLYICGFADIEVVRFKFQQILELISMNIDLTLDYAKQYEIRDITNDKVLDTGLINLWYKDNNLLYMGGWIRYSSNVGKIRKGYHGIIGEVDKSTGQITLKKIFQNTGGLRVISDGDNIYVVTHHGHILKLDNNYNIVSSKQLEGGIDNVANISMSSNYLITYGEFHYRDRAGGGVVVIDKNLTNAAIFNTYTLRCKDSIIYYYLGPMPYCIYYYRRPMSYCALVDNNNNLYYLALNPLDLNPSTNNLVLLKVNISKLSSPIQETVKEYNLNEIRNNFDLVGYSGAAWTAVSDQMGFLVDGNILLGITVVDKKYHTSEIMLLKIDKNNFNIINQVQLKLGGEGGCRLRNELNVMSIPNGDFIVSGPVAAVWDRGLTKHYKYIKSFNYILKCPSDLKITNKIIDVTNPNITEMEYTTYKINYNILKLRNVNIDEIPVESYRLHELPLSVIQN